MGAIGNKLREKAAVDIQSTKQMITVTPKRGLFNYKCFDNAAQYQSEYGGDVVEVVIVRCADPSLHYINRIDGEYLETTLGYRSAQYEYFYLRVITEEDYKHMSWVFENALATLSRPYIRWYHRLLGIKRVL
jgi:hypothetical protein